MQFTKSTVALQAFSVIFLLASCAINDKKITSFVAPRASNAPVEGAALKASVDPVRQVSKLWGKSGELWMSGSRLPDFSYAGYHNGESAIPVYPQTANIKSFGAKGDNFTDDTQAFKDAIASTQSGAILIPAGNYKITDFIYLRKSGVVLRGEGPQKTHLIFSKSLYEIAPKGSATTTGKITTTYAFDYAFLTLDGNMGKRSLAAIRSNSRRGDNEIELSNAKGIVVGQTIQIRVTEDTDQTLKTFLYTGDPGDIVNGKNLETKMIVKVEKISGNMVTIDRPLRFDTRSSWKPDVLAFEPTITESGIEDLSVDFPDLPYPGHFNEQGFNAIELRGAAHCWVKNVKIHNSDMGVLFAADSNFNTVDGVTISAYAGRGKLKGHHAFQLKRSQDNLIKNFDIQASFEHDLSVEHASGNVYADGRGEDLSFDHHRDTPYENLYTNLHVGLGQRIWISGGGAGLGRHSAAWETFWNIRADKAFDLPEGSYAPAMINLIGLNTNKVPLPGNPHIWFEAPSPVNIYPDNIWRAQLEKRMAKR